MMSVAHDRNYRGPAVGLLRLALLAGAMLAAPAFAAPATPAAPADAASPDDATGEDIVVSAQRFDQRLHDTPLSVSAFDGAMLADRQALNLRDISTLVPGLVVETVSGLQTAPRIFLRGVGQDSATFNADPAVGTYVDNVYVPRLYAGLFDFSDVERLEVLRGPQGTLYGRNTSGGAINIVTKRPSFTLTGAAEIAYGSFDQLDAKAYVSGPITDKLAVSLSVLHRQRDGISYAPNLNGGQHVNDREVNGQRVKLLFVPAEELEVTLTLEHNQDDTGPYYPSAIQVANPAQLPNANPGRNLFITDADTPSNDGRAEAWAGSLTARYSRDGLSVTSISAYRELKQNMIIPLSTIPGSNSISGIFFKNYSLSQELNAAYTSDRFNLVGGLYYFEERSQFENRVGTNPLEQSIQRTESYAAYAQGTFYLTPTLGLIVGGRYTYEKKPFWNYYAVPTAAVPVRYPLSETKSWDGFTPKIGIEFKPSEQVLAYANYTKGFKSGGWNRIAPSVQNGVLIYDLFPYNPEKVEAYEAGLKLETADRRASLNIAAYWNDLSGLQVTQQIPGTTIGRIVNAASARVKGVEVEASWTPVEGLQLYGNAAYTDAGYRGAFTCTDLTFAYRDCSGKDLRGVSPWKALAGFTWKLPVEIPGGFRIGLSANYTEKYYNDAFNNELVAGRTRTLVDGFISYETEDRRWTATLEGKNLTDKQYYGTALALGQTIVAYPSDPRTVVGRIRYAF